MNNNNKADDSVSKLGERIARIAAFLGGKKTLARKASVSESQLYRYISGQSQPTAQPLLSIARAADVDIKWLITGKSDSADPLLDRLQGQAQNPQNHLIEIPFYTLPEGSLPEEQVMGKVVFRKQWLQQQKLDIDSLQQAYAYGDSMEPTIYDGDLLLIDTSQKNVSGDAIFALLADNHLIAKRLQHAVDGGLYVSSDNPRYREQYVPYSDIEKLQIVGRVVWSAGKA